MESNLMSRRGTSLALLAARLGRKWARGRAIAVLRCSDARLDLIVSDRLRQPSLDYVLGLWATERHELRHGAVRTAGSETCLHVVIPCIANDRVYGLFYLEAPADKLPPLTVLHALGGIIAATLRGARGPNALLAPLGARPAVIATLTHAANLQALLDRHEWNIARVARLLGVTRMTVYNRMRRLGVARRKVRKQDLTRRPAALRPATTALAEAAHA